MPSRKCNTYEKRSSALKEYFEFDIKNKFSAYIYAVASSLLTGIMASVPVIIITEFISCISEYDAVIFCASLFVISLICFCNYCFCKKGVFIFDDYIIVNFAVIGYGFEPFKRKIKISSINSIKILNNAELNNRLRDVYGGNYDDGYVEIHFGKKDRYYNLSLENSEEFVKCINRLMLK